VFIPLAEECGLIVPLGYQVLRTACIQMKSWRDQGYALRTLAVNMSAVQLNSDGFVESVEQVLALSGLPGYVLELELTESALLTHPLHAKQVLARLKALGIRIALDDFGTGYSSMSSLQMFSVDTLKVDKSFVRDLATNPSDRKLVDAIIGLAHSLELSIVAEGVEDLSQKAHLERMKCGILQGYLFSKPGSAEVISNVLKNWQPAAPAKPARLKVVPSQLGVRPLSRPGTPRMPYCQS
jgi:EAL domain-containing protein (putative c-di-GMP-specific phosphodiesterase class I)